MQPQGTSLLNPQFFDNLTAQVNAINVCSELQAAVDAMMATVNAELAGIEIQLLALLPIITLPTDLASVITWIENFATPMIKPYLNYAEQLIQTAAAIASLVAAIEAAAARLTSCSITIPSVVIPSFPPV